MSWNVSVVLLCIGIIVLMLDCTAADPCTEGYCQNNATCKSNGTEYNCTCSAGWTGKNCSEDINDCEPNPCQNNASCTDKVNDYNCTCTPGYEGKNCSIDINDCEPNPCQNNASCTDKLNDYNCTCTPGWEGTNCTKNINDCDPNPCQNNASCTDKVNDYNCTCAPGWKGKNCSTDINDCDPNPCQNNASCTDKLNDYNCTCAPGWEGKTCTKNIDDCKQNPCMNGGNCTDKVNDYDCTCTPGWKGKNCSTDINDCEPNPCQNNANCTDKVNDYNCTCTLGWEGKNCSTDVDDCSPDPCANGNCTDQHNNYTCACFPGWKGRNCSENIDDCKQNPCMNGGNCTDKINDYNCTCAPGWEGKNCSKETDECSPNPCQHGNCTDEHNNYTCTCSPGWEGRNCSEDINECASSPCVNGTCINVEPKGSGKYICNCTTDYEGVNCNKTIDDCKENPCKNNGSCIDGIGNYRCNCTEQWTGVNCTQDVDECSLNGTCPNGFCQNLYGSYKCFCKQGWTGADCKQDINECSNRSICGGGKPGWVCSNTDGGFTCQCNSTTHVKRGSQCVEILMIADKSPEINKTGDDKVFGPFYVDGGIPYFSEMFYTFYVSTNGYVVLGRHFDVINPPLLKSDWPKDQMILAPYWSDIDMSSGGRLIVSEYYRYKGDAGVLDDIAKIINDGFEPQYAVTVSWHDASPYPAKLYMGYQNSTFQLIIATDGSKSYAVFTNIIFWKNIPKQHIVTGYSKPGNEPFYKALNTSTDQTQSRNKYKLFDVPGNKINSTNYDCLMKNFENKNVLVYNKTDDCPCSAVQAKLDPRFEFIENTLCCASRFWQENVRTKCCYDSNGVLVTDVKGSAWKEAENNTVNTVIQSEFESCCGNRSTLCSQFFKSHPSDSCEKYEPLKTVLFWGNPYNELDDDTFYIFNGLGEYQLLSESTLPISVQGRTTKISNVNITRFSAFAIKVKSYEFEFRFMETTKDVSVYFNSAKIDPGKITSDWIFESKNFLKSLLFKDGVIVEVIPGNEMLVLTVRIPLKFAKGLTGLIEVYSEKNLTKLQLAESEWLLKDSSASLFNYSLVGQNFSSLQDREFMPKQFTNFTEFLYILNDNNETNVNNSRQICDKNIACYLNYNYTANVTPNFKSEQAKVEVNAMKLKNISPPEFIKTVPTLNVNLNSQEMFVLNVSSSMVTSSDLEITVLSDVTGYSFNQTTRKFFWNITLPLRNISTRTDGVLKFLVKDKTNNLTGQYIPNIVFCGCQQPSQCLYQSVKYFSNKTKGMFYQVPCDCHGESSGRFCEEMVNVCKQKCYPESCKNSSSATCPPCPAGLKGNGSKCYGEDRCLPGKHPCEQMCENTADSFVCKCKAGYSLVNKTHCTDIDECTANETLCTDTGHKYCVNTPGSWRCQCRPGYKGDNCNIRVSHVYGGSLVFAQVPAAKQVWTDDLKDKNSMAFKDLAKHVEAVIKSVFEKSGLTLLSVTVVKFELVSSRGLKRSVSPNDYINTTYEIGFNKQVPAKQLNSAFNGGFDNSCKNGGKSCLFGNDTYNLLGVSKDQSDIKDTYNLCDSDNNNDCHDASTFCYSENGTYSCKCREGYKPWPIYKNICEDVDECSENKIKQLCGEEGINCVNVPGNYTCTCKDGYKWMGVSEKCALADACKLKKPCKNGATCVNIGDSTSGYACKCAYGWTGPNCENKDPEAKKQETIVIAVSASLGSLVFILLIVLLCCWCRRGHYKDDNSSNEFQVTYHSQSSAVEFQPDVYSRSSKIPRPSVRLGSNTNGYEMAGSQSSKVTKFDYDTLNQYDNPAYDRVDDEANPRL